MRGSGYDGGDPPGPVADTEENDYPYDFTIVATPASGKEFSSDAPFAATNPSGTVPSGGETVTNTLTGTVITSPSTIAGKFYLLQACLTGAEASAGGLEGPGNAYIYLSSAPKSNSSYIAYNDAKAFIREHQQFDVPLHLRNAPTKLMENLDYFVI